MAKKLFAELGLAYIDDVTKISSNYDEKILELEERISNLEDTLGIDLNEDIAEEEKISLSESITCPYCGNEFLVEYDETNHEITCPECNNLIELDWGEFEDDM